MTKQSVILTKHIHSTHLLELLYYSLRFLDKKSVKPVKESLLQIDSIIANSDVGTKWKLTLEKVEDENT